MFNLLAIGDPIIDTHVQIGDDSAKCRLLTEQNEKKLCLDYGAKIPIVDSFQALGGNASNVAVAAVKLGLSAALVSTIGDDANGHTILEKLKHFSVNSDYVTFESGATSRYSIVLNYCGERTILSYSEKKNYIWPEPIAAAEWVYYTGLSEGFEPIQAELFRYLENHQAAQLVINPGSYMLRYALPALREAISRADIVIVNLEEAELILETTMEKEKNISALIHGLCELGAEEAVLTDGEHGAWAGNKEEVWHVEAFPVSVTSKTGAGDAFSAAYMAARHYGLDYAAALLWGAANSYGVIQAHGPHAGLMKKEGITKTIARFPNVKPTLVK